MNNKLKVLKEAKKIRATSQELQARSKAKPRASQELQASSKDKSEVYQFLLKCFKDYPHFVLLRMKGEGKGKAPLKRGWNDKSTHLNFLRGYIALQQKVNIGVVLGNKYFGIYLLCIDIDTKDKDGNYRSVGFANAHLEATKKAVAEKLGINPNLCMIVKSGGEGYHFYCLANVKLENKSSIPLKVGSETFSIDLLAKNRQAVFVGSVHPNTKNRYTLLEANYPQEQDTKKLIEYCNKNKNKQGRKKNKTINITTDSVLNYGNNAKSINSLDELGTFGQGESNEFLLKHVQKANERGVSFNKAKLHFKSRNRGSELCKDKNQADRQYQKAWENWIDKIKDNKVINKIYFDYVIIAYKKGLNVNQALESFLKHYDHISKEQAEIPFGQAWKKYEAYIDELKYNSKKQFIKEVKFNVKANQTDNQRYLLNCNFNLNSKGNYLFLSRMGTGKTEHITKNCDLAIGHHRANIDSIIGRQKQQRAFTFTKLLEMSNDYRLDNIYDSIIGIDECTTLLHALDGDFHLPSKKSQIIKFLRNDHQNNTFYFYDTDITAKELERLKFYLDSELNICKNLYRTPIKTIHNDYSYDEKTIIEKKIIQPINNNKKVFIGTQKLWHAESLHKILSNNIFLNDKKILLVTSQTQQKDDWQGKAIRSITKDNKNIDNFDIIISTASWERGVDIQSTNWHVVMFDNFEQVKSAKATIQHIGRVRNPLSITLARLRTPQKDDILGVLPLVDRKPYIDLNVQRTIKENQQRAIGEADQIKRKKNKMLTYEQEQHNKFMQELNKDGRNAKTECEMKQEHNLIIANSEWSWMHYLKFYGYQLIDSQGNKLKTPIRTKYWYKFSNDLKKRTSILKELSNEKNSLKNCITNLRINKSYLIDEGMATKLKMKTQLTKKEQAELTKYQLLKGLGDIDQSHLDYAIKPNEAVFKKHPFLNFFKNKEYCKKFNKGSKLANNPSTAYDLKQNRNMNKTILNKWLGVEAIPNECTSDNLVTLLKNTKYINQKDITDLVKICMDNIDIIRQAIGVDLDKWQEIINKELKEGTSFKNINQFFCFFFKKLAGLKFIRCRSGKKFLGFKLDEKYYQAIKLSMQKVKEPSDSNLILININSDGAIQKFKEIKNSYLKDLLIARNELGILTKEEQKIPISAS